VESPILVVDHSLPSEHHLAGAEVSTICCDLVVRSTEELVGRLSRTDPSMIVYDERARWSNLDDLRNQRWAYVYGTNLHEAIALARSSMTSPAHLLIVAHSRPSAHLTSGGEVVINFPPLRETVEATASEIARCRDEGSQVDLLVVPTEPRVEVPPWPTEIMSAVRLTGGSFTQARDEDQLRRWVDDQVP
jgi:hypothetical protein